MGGGPLYIYLTMYKILIHQIFATSDRRTKLPPYQTMGCEALPVNTLYHFFAATSRNHNATGVMLLDVLCKSFHLRRREWLGVYSERPLGFLQVLQDNSGWLRLIQDV